MADSVFNPTLFEISLHSLFFIWATYFVNLLHSTNSPVIVTMDYYRVIVAVSLVALSRGDLIPSNLLRQKVEEVSVQLEKEGSVRRWAFQISEEVEKDC